MKWVAPIISSVLFACGSGSPTPESSSLRFPLKDPANGKTSPSLGRSATAQNVDDLLATLGRDGSSLTASPGPSASLTGYGQPLPQGLTCGLSYTDGYGIVAKNTCNGIPTMELVPSSGIGVCYSGFSRCEGCNCIGSPDTQCFPTPFFPYPIDTRDPYIYACQAYEPDGLLVQAGPGFVRIWDNDSGVGYTPGEYYLPGPFGFWHQELVDGTTDVTLSDTFVLPKGTACGLHYPFLPAGFTQFHNRTCMGYNPAKAFGWELDDLNSQTGCPPGWLAKKAFDMNSNWGYWTWCEYQDPKNLSPGSLQTPDGVVCGLALDDTQGGVVGQCMGQNTYNGQDVTSCPANTNMKSSLWLDDGRASGRGLGFCTTRAFVLPPRGYLDTPTTDHSGNLSGWAYDPATPSVSSYVDFYLDAPAGSLLAKFAGHVLADGSRPDVDAAFVITGNHGFSFTVPAQYQDGRAHGVYAYAFGSAGNNPPIANTPASFVWCGAGSFYCSYTNQCLVNGSSCAPPCAPSSCGVGSCGYISDGCGGRIYCGACPPACKNCYSP